MPQNPDYIPRIVNLTLQDYRTVRRLANEKGLGSKGFSAALRMIIREWQAFTQKAAEGEAFRQVNGTSPREWSALQPPTPTTPPDPQTD
jgi:hypothetical protein